MSRMPNVMSMSVTTLDQRQVPLDTHVGGGGGRLVGKQFPAAIIGLVVYAEITEISSGSTLHVEVCDGEFKIVGQSGRVRIDDASGLLTPRSHVWTALAVPLLMIEKPGTYSITLVADGKIIAERALWIFAEEPTNWRHAGEYLIANPPEGDCQEWSEDDDDGFDGA